MPHEAYLIFTLTFLSFFTKKSKNRKEKKNKAEKEGGKKRKNKWYVLKKIQNSVVNLVLALLCMI